MKREVVCGDAFEWLLDPANQGLGPVVTSPPDAAEIELAITEWVPWFRKALVASLVAADPHPAVFYVTDRKYERVWHSKAQMVHDAAQRYGYRVLWHKIALRRDVGAVDLHRPGYSHLIAVGGPGTGPGVATPDVFHRGPVLYSNGMGTRAAFRAVTWAKEAGHEWVVNPFCGRGTVLAAAYAVGLNSVGIDNDPAQCRYAEEVVL